MTWKAQDEEREWHPATSSDRCFDLEKRLRDEGIDVRLVGYARTTDNILKVACIFDGPDADPNAERWKSYQETD
jgi:hypothetical protein